MPLSDAERAWRWRYRHPDKWKATKAAWIEKNLEAYRAKLAETNKAYKKANPDKVRAWARAAYARDPEKFRARAKATYARRKAKLQAAKE